jgi:hypothetical protein
MKPADQMVLITEEETEKIKKLPGQCIIIGIMSILLSFFFLIIILTCATIFDDNPRNPLYFGILIGLLAASLSITGVVSSRSAMKKNSMIGDETLRKKARLAFILSLVGLGLFIVVVLMISIFFFAIYINEIMHGPPPGRGHPPPMHSMGFAP